MEVPFIKGVFNTDLRKIWRSQEVFAEEILHKSSTLFGFNENNCSMGYNDLSEENSHGLIKLCYKLKDEKKQKVPKIEKHWFFSYLDFFTHHEIDFKFSVINLGAKSKGLSVVFFGEAVGKEYITMKEATVKLYNSKNKYIESYSNIFLDTLGDTNNDKRVFLAEFPDIEFDSGNVKKHPRIEINVSGCVYDPVHSSLNIVVYPHENSNEGQTGFTTKLYIKDGKKPMSLHDYEILERSLINDCRVAIQQFSKTKDNEDVYAFVLDCDTTYGDIFIKINNINLLNKSFKYYKEKWNYTDERGVCVAMEQKTGISVTGNKIEQ